MKISSDIHIHTALSSCARPDATVEAYVEGAKRDGLSVLGFSDHLWDSAIPGVSGWYRPQNVEHVLQLKKELPKNGEMDGIKILFGCETEFTHESKLCLAEENFQLFDYVLVPHSHTHMNVVVPRERIDTLEAHAKYLMDSFMMLVEHPLAHKITSIAHPFVPGTKFDIYNATQALIPSSYFYEAFAAAREVGVAIELNGSCLHDKSESGLQNCEYARIYTIAKECGCRFTYGSDSHSTVGDTRGIGAVARFFEICGITENDLLSVDEIIQKSKNNPKGIIL